jgi:hypothetical protein
MRLTLHPFAILMRHLTDLIPSPLVSPRYHDMAPYCMRRQFANPHQHTPSRFGVIQHRGGCMCINVIKETWSCHGQVAGEVPSSQRHTAKHTEAPSKQTHAHTHGIVGSTGSHCTNSSERVTRWGRSRSHICGFMQKVKKKTAVPGLFALGRAYEKPRTYIYITRTCMDS